jgi:nicotinate-nucleotide adenylyltransferase
MPAIVLQNVRRLGVLGGTFDPIHYGHLQIAEEARERFALDAVLFIPTGEPPHKPAGQANAEQRFLMAELATADNPRFAVSRLEIDRPGPSYTADTLEALRARYPEAARYLIIGADMAMDFPAWREPERILGLARIVAATRPGVPEARLRRHLAAPAMQAVELLVAPGLDISSTELRRRVAEGKSLRYLTPDPVVGFIEKEGLYRA